MLAGACSRQPRQVMHRPTSAQGKVRDTYVVVDKLVIVTTDRQSAFDRLLASIPFKVPSLAASPAPWLGREPQLGAVTALSRDTVASPELEGMQYSCTAQQAQRVAGP